MICKNCKTEIDNWISFLQRWRGGRRICPSCGLTIYTEYKHELLVSNIILTVLLVLVFAVIFAVFSYLLGPVILTGFKYGLDNIQYVKENLHEFNTTEIKLACTGWGALTGATIGLLTGIVRILHNLIQNI